MEVACARCGIVVHVWPSKLKLDRKIFCSRACSAEDKKGQSVSWELPAGTERRQEPKGYILEKTDDGRGWVMQHRLVVERSLGRQLFREENVHHINGVRDDNRLENLELWTTMQPSGKRVVDVVEFAKKIMELYGEEVESHAQTVG